MEEIHYSFRMLALSQVILLCLYLLLYERNRLGLLIAATAFTFACYLVMPFRLDPTELSFINESGIIISSSAPAILWLLAQQFFNDEKPIPLGFWLTWLLYMLLGIPPWREMEVMANPALSGFLFDLLPQTIKLGFVLHVIYMALAGRANDLVARRLALRVPIAITAGLLSSAIILIEIWSAGSPPLIIEAISSVGLFLIALGGNIYLFRLRSDLPLASTKESISPHIATERDFEAEILAIQKAMTEHRFYANHGATISDLADTVSIPAYRLRVVINQQLNFRNFNQFLNQYRIEEATMRLTRDAGPPILSIALDVGFKSLSSFNKAFREIHDKTPSEYRSAPTPD
jgi:AraC-like DNA-binding protein